MVSSRVRTSSTTCSVGGPAGQATGPVTVGIAALRQPSASLGLGETQVAGTVSRMRLTMWSGVMSRASAS